MQKVRPKVITATFAITLVVFALIGFFGFYILKLETELDLITSEVMYISGTVDQIEATTDYNKEKLDNLFWDVVDLTAEINKIKSVSK